MSDALVLTFDVGTQSLRAMLFDSSGEIVAKVQKKYEQPFFSPQPGMAEQEPDFYFEHLCRASTELKHKAPEAFARVKAVTLTAIRETPLCLDENYKPLRNIIIWLDNREAQGDVHYCLPVRAALKIIGMDETAKQQYKVSVCNWIMENQPEIWAKTKKYVLVSTYLNYLLTGELADSPASQIAHIPFNYRKRKWMKHGVTRPLFNVPMDKLCRLVESGQTIGHITERASELTGIPAGLPLIATGSDKGCETLGLSVTKEHQAALSFGTTATVQFATENYFEPQRFFPSYPAVIPWQYNPEMQIYKGYWLVSWFKDEFSHKECEQAEIVGRSAESLLDEMLGQVPPGCDGLILQPYWCPGVADPTARGAIIGFSDEHTRAHVYRAIIEGLGFALLEGLKKMEKRSGQRITELYVGGGGSQSDEICAITADIFNLPVRRIQTHESSGLGASIVAFVAMGEFVSYDEAIAAMVHPKDEFLPDKHNADIYSRIYNDIYVLMYKKLLPFYKTMKKHRKK